MVAQTAWMAFDQTPWMILSHTIGWPQAPRVDDVDNDATNQFGTTPLLALARMEKGTLRGRIESAKKMVEAGANLKVEDGDGKLAWEIVSEQAGSEELAKVLTPK